jgi:hypothetical protein
MSGKTRGAPCLGVLGEVRAPGARQFSEDMGLLPKMHLPTRAMQWPPPPLPPYMQIYLEIFIFLFVLPQKCNLFIINKIPTNILKIPFQNFLKIYWKITKNKITLASSLGRVPALLIVQRFFFSIYA